MPSPRVFRARLQTVSVAFFAMLALSACVARQDAAAVAPDTPGFLLGLWHGFIFPVAWFLSLFFSNISVYAVPNNGGWYDFGYFVGIVFLGVGARKTKKVTIVRWRDR
ncbi:MAG: hypothetical protein R3E04_02580 [Sphingobium sp.]